jgi:glycosyltransferase involved in cell wall biosynthesis
VTTILQIDRQRLTGQAMRTLSEVRGIKKRGYRVILACQPGTYLERSGREHSLEILPIDMNRFPSALLRLSLFLKKEKVDLINAHGYRDHLLTVLAGRIAGVKVLIRTKHNHVPLKGGAFSRFIYGRLTDRIIAISGHIKNVMIDSGIDPSRITTIHTSVDLDYFSPRPKNERLLKEFELEPGCPVIGSVARLSDRKGMPFLLDALKLLKDEGRRFFCLIVGGGGSSSEEKIALLKQKAESQGLTPRLVFTGLRNDIPEILSLIDYFVLPSLDEGLGRSLVEAMAAGKPVVASRVGGIPEAVEDGTTGILVPPGDAHALAKALSAMLDHPGIAAEMGRRGRERAEKFFDEERMVDSICLLYRELLGHGANNKETLPATD